MLLRLPAARGNQSAQQLFQFLEQCCVVAAAGIAPKLHDDIQIVELCCQLAVHDAYQAFDPVTIYRARGNFLADDQSEPRTVSGIGQSSGQKTVAARPAAACQYSLELRRFRQTTRSPLGGAAAIPRFRQTLRRARPFARRARMTARPPRVFMRTRNPWVRWRRVLDG